MNNTPIREINFHAISRKNALIQNGLLYGGISYFEDLSNYSEKDILKFPNIGAMCINAIKDTMEKNNLNFKEICPHCGKEK
tara:strand:- start:748 stop:990 length:243 start_codon:yes stop_codon:yes gene_type:complete